MTLNDKIQKLREALRLQIENMTLILNGHKLTPESHKQFTEDCERANALLEEK